MLGFKPKSNSQINTKLAKKNQKRKNSKRITNKKHKSLKLTSDDLFSKILMSKHRFLNGSLSFLYSFYLLFSMQAEGKTYDVP